MSVCRGKGGRFGGGGGTPSCQCVMYVFSHECVCVCAHCSFGYALTCWKQTDRAVPVSWQLPEVVPQFGIQRCSGGLITVTSSGTPCTLKEGNDERNFLVSSSDHRHNLKIFSASFYCKMFSSIIFLLRFTNVHTPSVQYVFGKKYCVNSCIFCFAAVAEFTTTVS